MTNEHLNKRFAPVSVKAGEPEAPCGPTLECHERDGNTLAHPTVLDCSYEEVGPNYRGRYEPDGKGGVNFEDKEEAAECSRY